jgi:hypothetical protein
MNALPFNPATLEKRKYQMNSAPVSNFCIPGAMSFCRAGKNWADHRLCRFYRKSTLSSRCMHFLESFGGHCDCVSAQREGRTAASVSTLKT